MAISDQAVGTASKLLARVAVGALLLVSLLAVGTLDHNPLTPWKLTASNGSTDRLRTYASRIRLERIEEAIRVFYLDSGTVPESLERLADNGYLETEDLLDPWGRVYALPARHRRLSARGAGAAGGSQRRADRKAQVQRKSADDARRLGLSGLLAGQVAIPGTNRPRHLDKLSAPS